MRDPLWVSVGHPSGIRALQGHLYGLFLLMLKDVRISGTLVSTSDLLTGKESQMEQRTFLKPARKHLFVSGREKI